MTALRLDLVAEVLGTGLGVTVPVEPDGAGAPVADVAGEQWRDAAELARNALGLGFVDWLSAVDRPDGAAPPTRPGTGAVEVVLHVLDPGAPTRRLLLRTRVSGREPRLASLTRLWPGVAWHERETFEMFGVVFDGFDDGQLGADGAPLGLRPLLLPEGFEGTPLRKSFVLAARVSKPWPGAKEPGEASASTPGRRTSRPPGVPDPSWGPREPAPEPQSEPEPPQQPGQEPTA